MQFTVTNDHIKLLRSAYVGWDGCEFGAPAIDCKRPYGNSSVELDIAEILGWTIADVDEGLTQEQELRAELLHRETQTALQIFLSLGTMEAGTYIRPSQYDYRTWHVSVEESQASLSERDAVTPTGGYINTVGALREAFATLPDNAPLIVQVVAQDKTVWNVWAKAALGKDCGFKWKVNPAILSLSHPDLHTLSASGDAAPPRDTERLDEIQARYIGANFRYDFDDVTQGCAIIIQIETSAKVTGDIRKDVDALLAARNSKSETPRTP